MYSCIIYLVWLCSDEHSGLLDSRVVDLDLELHTYLTCLAIPLLLTSTLTFVLVEGFLASVTQTICVSEIVEMGQFSPPTVTATSPIVLL